MLRLLLGLLGRGRGIGRLGVAGASTILVPLHPTIFLPLAQASPMAELGVLSCGCACSEDARGTHGGVGCRRGCLLSTLAPSFMSGPLAVGMGRLRGWV